MLGFAVALCGFGLGELARQLYLRRRTGTLRRAATAGAVAALLLPLAGALAARPLVSDRAENGTATVAVVQGNVPRMGLDFNAQRRAVLDYHARETARLAERVAKGEVAQPDFVLWPENSSDIDPFTNDDARSVIERAATTIKAPISVGAVVQPEDGRLYNQQILWDPDKGPVDTYDKRVIQPFGEYIPLRSLISVFSQGYVDMVRTDFSRGTDPGVFDLAGSRVGIATCYEAAFDGAVRETVDAGAQLLSVPSNNATFGFSEMTYQQLAMSRVRAVEHSRAVAVPVTSGVSAVIRPDGELVQRTGMFEPASSSPRCRCAPRRPWPPGSARSRRPRSWPSPQSVSAGPPPVPYAVAAPPPRTPDRRVRPRSPGPARPRGGLGQTLGSDAWLLPTSSALSAPPPDTSSCGCPGSAPSSSTTRAASCSVAAPTTAAGRSSAASPTPGSSPPSALSARCTRRPPCSASPSASSWSRPCSR